MTERYKPTVGALLAFIAGICIGLDIWSGAKFYFAIDEAWDSFGYYFASMLIGGFLGGLIFRVNYPFVVVGLFISQMLYLMALIVLKNDSGQGLLPVGLATLLLCSVFARGR